MPAFKHILVPTDFGDASEHALAVALDLATKFEAKVTLLHTTWLPPY
jgi:nucleotide-binding universal stress UspA family protein